MCSVIFTAAVAGQEIDERTYPFIMVELSPLDLLADQASFSMFPLAKQ